VPVVPVDDDEHDGGCEFDDRGFGLCLLGEKHDARGTSLSEVEEEEDAASSDLVAAFAAEIDIDCGFGFGCGFSFRGTLELAGEPDRNAAAGLLPA
jgi:hypothetical protein